MDEPLKHLQEEFVANLKRTDDALHALEVSASRGETALPVDTTPAISVAVIVVDLSTANILKANVMAEELFGYGAGEMVGMSVHDLLPADQRDVHRKWFEEYRSAPAARYMGRSDMRLGGVTKGGEYFNVAVVLYPRSGLRTVIAAIERIGSRGD